MNELITSLAPLAITGAIVSIIIQATKNVLSKSGHKVLLTIGVSIVCGTILQFTPFVPTPWIETIVAVFAAANTVYLAVIKLIAE